MCYFISFSFLIILIIGVGWWYVKVVGGGRWWWVVVGGGWRPLGTTEAFLGTMHCVWHESTLYLLAERGLLSSHDTQLFHDQPTPLRLSQYRRLAFYM